MSSNTCCDTVMKKVMACYRTCCDEETAKPEPGSQSYKVPEHEQDPCPSLGVIRLDYDYPPALGDIDHSGSFKYPVYYRVVPGLTFQICQEGKLDDDVKEEFIKAIKFLVEEKKVSIITGDCGFMMYFQKLARQHTHLPVCMSSLAQLPAVTSGYSKNEQIAIFTANGKTLEPMRDLIREECGVNTKEKRYIIVGCEDVPGFDAVEKGEKVDVEYVTPGIVAKAKKVLEDHPNVRAFLLECTELPPYSDAIRHHTGLPVYDSITCCDFFIDGRHDAHNFGVQWQKEWDGKQEKYVYGQHLTEAQYDKLQTKEHEDNVLARSESQVDSSDINILRVAGTPIRAAKGLLGGAARGVRGIFGGN
mmetsp:Transcript_24040/g.81991  ORF Transcript_24040/g.81991 Transcript_24040/m.81991 type:complete len:361 (-) Transcript_24040:125-1207(-)